MRNKNFLKNNLKKIFWNSFSIILIILLWEAGAKFNLLKTTYFPPPSQVLLRFIYLIANSKTNFLKDIYASFYRFSVASIISIPLAVLTGFAIGLNKYLYRFFNPLVAVTYPIPKLAILPLLFLLFGIENESKIIIIGISIFYLVMINSVHGIKRLTSSEYLDIVRIYKFPFITKLFVFYLRGSLPEILNGIKLGMGYGLVMIVGSEFTASKDGVGLFIWSSWDQFRTIDLYCGLYVLSIVGIIIFFTIDTIINNLQEFKK